MFNKDNVYLGIAPIGWTNDDMPHLGKENTFEQCISEAALVGFEGTEIGNKYPTDPVVLKEKMALRGLRVASQWISTTLCTESYEENEKAFIKQLDFLEKAGANRINVCEISRNIITEAVPMFGEMKPVATDEEWEKLCDGLNRLGKIATQRGFILCFHHHMATVVQTVDEVKRLLDNTNPEFVYLCYDSGHFTLSGEDPVAACRLFVDRIGHVHLKDIRKQEMDEAIAKDLTFRQTVLVNCFTVPGDGFVDFVGIFDCLSENDYQGWLLVEAEQNPAISNPFEYAVKARKYIKETINI